MAGAVNLDSTDGPEQHVAAITQILKNLYDQKAAAGTWGQSAVTLTFKGGKLTNIMVTDATSLNL